MTDIYRWADTERFVCTLDELCRNDGTDARVHRLRMSYGRCAVANGCFDVLHPGHLSLLAYLDTYAYERRLRPIVAMNSDASVRRLKGQGRPVMSQEARAAVINCLKWPFSVVIFDEDTPQRLMDLMWPTAVLKGAEYATTDVVRWRGSKDGIDPPSEVVTVPMFEDWSTSRIVGDTR